LSLKGVQLSLFDEAQPALGKHGTFNPNHKESVHRWYPYIEGFSAQFVSNLLDEFGSSENQIYDPFAGTGTTMTVAASRGMPAFYSEINPFMRLVIESKTNNLIWAIENINILKKYFTEILDKVKYNLPSDQDALEIFNQAFKNKVYYQSSRLIEVIALKQIIHQSDVVCQLKEFAYLALGSIAVECSELKRASDLRYRRQNEYLPLNLSVLDKFKDKTDQIYQDILRMTDNLSRFSPVTCLEESALVSGDKTDFIDLIITSPPYLNGTNYFRNTKIELWLTGFLNNEKDLELFRQKAMAAGINNISRNNREIIPIVEIESFVSNL